jgi:hypothetical protein
VRLARAVKDRKDGDAHHKTADEAEPFYAAYATGRTLEGSHDSGKGVVSFKGKVRSLQSMGSGDKRYWFVEVQE